MRRMHRAKNMRSKLEESHDTTTGDDLSHACDSSALALSSDSTTPVPTADILLDDHANDKTPTSNTPLEDYTTDK